MSKGENKSCGNRAIELLQLINKALELGESGATEKDKDKDKEGSPSHDTDSRGKNQPVGDYPDSPLRYGGGISRKHRD